jgi:hypothetical protein
MKKENAHCIPKNTAGATDKPHSATTMHRVKELALPSTGATNQPNNFGLQIAGTCTAASRYGTMTTDANKHHGSEARLSIGAVAAPSLESGFFTSMYCAWHARLSFLVGRVGTPARVCRFLLPVFRPHTVCHPLPEAVGGRFQTCSIGAIMANTLTPKGHTAPAPLPTTGKQSHTFDPVAAHGQAVNALAMAKFYANRHNHAGAARKCVQALSALRQLAAFERVEANHAV